VKTLVIVTHPELEKSMNPNITIRNLYETYPDEQIQVDKEQELLEKHDRIILQFPFDLYSAPSFMKKWIDQVMTYGFAYGTDGNKLHGKDLMLAISTGEPEEFYQAGGMNLFSMSELLKPYQATSHLIGTYFLPSYVFHNVNLATNEELEKGTSDYIHRIFTA